MNGITKYFIPTEILEPNQCTVLHIGDSAEHRTDKLLPSGSLREVVVAGDGPENNQENRYIIPVCDL